MKCIYHVQCALKYVSIVECLTHQDVADAQRPLASRNLRKWPGAQQARVRMWLVV